MKLRSLLATAPVIFVLACSSGDSNDNLFGGGVGATPGVGGGGASGPGTGGVGVGGGGQPGVGGGQPSGGLGGGAATGSGGLVAGSGGSLVTTGGVQTNTGGVQTNTGGVQTNTGGAQTNTGGAQTNTGGTTQGTTEYTVDEGGFVSVCNWTGYAWTDSDEASSINPSGFDTVSAGTQLCANGTVQPRDDWGGYAMLGINIGQAVGDGTEAYDISTSGSGIYVDVQNNTGNELRIQIQSADSETDSGHRWCAIYSGPGEISWNEFNTACWDGSGSTYSGEPINAVLVMVPGHNTDSRSFDFCINNIEPQGGSCESTAGTGGSSGTGGSAPTGGSSPTGGASPTGGSGTTTLPDLQGGENGFATRYWDCCKPSCGWTANASNPVDSCDINDNNIGVDDNARNGCEGGTAFTCHSWAPWALSDRLSYGFAAFNGASCGSCYQIRFSGSSSRGSPTPGIDGKQMVVQVTNVGGIEGGQFDLLIPGGGVGDFNGCSSQWGASDLGVQYGGFRSTCGPDSGCIRNMCQNAFGDSPELMAGCDWYIDWLQMADNPDIRFAPIDCPAELRAVSGG